MRCPGQDTQFWDKESIYTVECPNCCQEIEFFKDDNGRKCPNCLKIVRNPKKDLGCLEYCKYAKECIASMPIGDAKK